MITLLPDHNVLYLRVLVLRVAAKNQDSAKVSCSSGLNHLWLYSPLHAEFSKHCDEIYDFG